MPYEKSAQPHLLPSQLHLSKLVSCLVTFSLQGSRELWSVSTCDSAAGFSDVADLSSWEPEVSACKDGIAECKSVSEMQRNGEQGKWKTQNSLNKKQTNGIPINFMCNC